MTDPLLPLARDLARLIREREPITAIGLSEVDWERLSLQTWAILRAWRAETLADLKTKKS